MATVATERVQTQFLTIRQFSERHPWPSEGGLRHLIFNAEENGFVNCIRRVGRRVLLSESDVLNWIDSQTADA